MAVISSTQESSALPDKDLIAPNQKTWTETAARMGIKRVPKQKQLPEGHRLTKRCIGVTRASAAAFIVTRMPEVSDRVSRPNLTRFLPQRMRMHVHVCLLPLPVPVPPLQDPRVTPIPSHLCNHQENMNLLFSPFST
jgi:hypothetical protein